MKTRILDTLDELRAYALERGHTVELLYHEEDSHLMRFANSAISLNTNEHLVRLDVTAYEGRKRASYGLIADPADVEGMQEGIDLAAEMAKHAQALTYEPTIPVYERTFVDEAGYDPALAGLGNQERLDYMNAAVEGLESDEVKMSGIFSCGSNIVAATNTRSEHNLYFRTSDAQITVVLAHATAKWEVIAEQSAQNVSELDPAPLRQDLDFLLDLYRRETPQQLPLGTYDVILGPAATAELVSIMNWIGISGGSMKRGFSFLDEDDVGQQVFSPRFSLTDDPARLETYPYKMDLTGIPRGRYPLFEGGVFQGFVWFQDDADEFGAEPTGHTVFHKSLVIEGGEREIGSLQELVDAPREKDVLYIPFLHYMNIVNPSRGIMTATSRFGTLLLKADGSVAIPFNVRLTQSLLDIFGEKVDWLSRDTVAYNTSQSYGRRDPTAIIVPRFIKIDGLEISHSNAAF
ncbi:MAG: metallopeptidase TldD-related protein [Anaerolineae bacterium]